MLSMLIITIVSLATGTARAGHLPAERIEPALARRQDGFTGGWSLRQSTCPTGAFVCPKFEGMPACCPDGTECEQSYMTGHNYVACCPKGQSCQKLIHSLPVCADPDWILYTHKTLYKSSFCCLPGQKAYVTTQSGDHPACGSENLAIESTNIASTIRPATALEGPATKVAGTPKAATTSKGTSKSTADNSDTSTAGTSSPDMPKDSVEGSKSKSSVPVGGIVGGVVGGVAVLGLVALGFFYIARIGRKRAHAPAPSAPGQYVPSPGTKVPEPVYAEHGPSTSWNGPTPPQQLSPYQPPATAPPYLHPESELDGQGLYRPDSNSAGYQEMDGVGRRCVGVVA